MRRADRITIDAFRCDLLTTSPLDGVVQSQHDGSSGSKRAHQQAEQDLTSGEGRPEGTVQHPMVVLKLRVLAQAHDAQDRGHGAFARRENCTHEQDLSVLEYRIGEKRYE